MGWEENLRPLQRGIPGVDYPLGEDFVMHWIDRWARRTAGGDGHRGLPEPSSAASSTTRRDFLRRAAVVGTAVWSVPVLQSVAAPVAAASGDCSQVICGIGTGCPLCESGIPCDVAAECVTGICAGVCQPGGISTPCASSADCTAGECSGRTGGPTTCGGPGSDCTGNDDCTFGNCSGGGVCGGAFTPCSTSAVCSPSRRCILGRCLAL
jgi:hypothetical protein